MTGIGNGVPSASCQDSATEVTSAAVMKPASGAKAPDSSSSRSASCGSVRVQDGTVAADGPAAAPSAAVAPASPDPAPLMSVFALAWTAAASACACEVTSVLPARARSRDANLILTARPPLGQP